MLSVNSRIIVNTAFFRQINPNYIRPSITSVDKYRDNTTWELLIIDPLGSPPNKGKTKSVDRAKLKEDDFLVCSLTVLGFSLEDKLWCKSRLYLLVLVMWLILPYSRICGRRHYRDCLEPPSSRSCCY
jgi:hypothetical protein